MLWINYSNFFFLGILINKWSYKVYPPYFQNYSIFLNFLPAIFTRILEFDMKRWSATLITGMSGGDGGVGEIKILNIRHEATCSAVRQNGQ